MYIKNLTLSFGIEKIFDDITLHIKDNEKVGIVGVNGAGKTTFFKVIMGLVKPDNGEVLIPSNTRVAHLPQVINDEIPNEDITTFEFLELGRPIDKLNKKLMKLYDKIAITKDERELEKIYRNIEKTTNELEFWEYYKAENELLKIIEGMEISSDMLTMKISNLSGGQKSKVAFARLLYSKPELILLDEPTNHLDSKTRTFVIDYLKNYKGGMFIISHDIKFLNDITTSTLYLDKMTKKMELYNGNYSIFEKLHTAKVNALMNIQKKEEVKIEKLEAIVNKYTNSSGKRKKMAQDREKKLAKLKANRVVIAPKQKNVKMTIKSDYESGMIPIKLMNVSFKYDKNNSYNIINDLSIDIYKNEKLLIVGENGVGKSTLLKLIVGILILDSGAIEIGNKTKIGYYAQEHELLIDSKSVIDNLEDNKHNQKEIRSVLSSFLFTNNDIYKPVSVLSPGEKARLSLAKLSLIGANVLILDEPTNHLDPSTQRIIADVLKSFNGTMLVVSHNKEFIDNLGIERVLSLPSGNISYK